MPTTSRIAAALIVLAAVTSAEAGSPRLTRVIPPGGQRGATFDVVFYGRYLEKPEEVLFYEPGIKAVEFETLEGEYELYGRKPRGGTVGRRVRVRLKVAEDCPLGAHGLRLRTLTGVTEYRRFFIGPFPTVEEDEQTVRNDVREAAKDLALNSTVHGRMNDPNDVDLFRIKAKRGDRLSAEIEASRFGIDRGIPDLHVAILSDSGKTLVEADDSPMFEQDPAVSVVADRDGTYFVQVRHSNYAAANDAYRLHVGTFPRPTGFYPAGGQAGTELSAKVLGDPKGGVWETKIPLPAGISGEFPFALVDPETGVSAPTPNFLRVSAFPNVLETEPNDTPEEASPASPVALPIAFNGIIEKPGDVDCFRFQAKKGDRFRIQAFAKALGSPADPTVWVKQVGTKSKSPIARATDSRPNQLGISPFSGMMRETLDPVLEFSAPADGEYVLGVEDDGGEGGSDYVYRVECQPDVDAVYTYIPTEQENRFMPQSRQTVTVAAGNRYNTQVAIFSTGRSYSGELELVALGLPEGVTMSAPKLTAGMTRVPVVFQATANAKQGAKFVDIVARPVGGEKGKELASGYRQTISMNMYGNNDFYLQHVVNKLVVDVSEPAAFHIEVDEPKSALVQNGEMSIKFAIKRDKGFTGPVTVSLEWRPNGVTTATPVLVPEGKSEGEYPLGANKNASAGSYEVTLTGMSGGQRASFYDAEERDFVASQPFKLTVAEPHLEGKLSRTSIERGKTGPLVCKLSQLKPFQGKAKATLGRLPRGVVLVEPIREFTSEDKEIVFNLKATEDCLLGSYQGIVLDATVVEDGRPIRQLSGYGMLRIDPERVPQTTSR